MSFIRVGDTIHISRGENMSIPDINNQYEFIVQEKANAEIKKTVDEINEYLKENEVMVVNIIKTLLHIHVKEMMRLRTVYGPNNEHDKKAVVRAFIETLKLYGGEKKEEDSNNG